MLGGKHEPVTYLVCWLIGRPIPLMAMFYSKKLLCDINLCSMIAFLVRRKHLTDYQTEELFRFHWAVIEELVSGKELQDKN